MAEAPVTLVSVLARIARAASEGSGVQLTASEVKLLQSYLDLVSNDFPPVAVVITHGQ